MLNHPANLAIWTIFIVCANATVGWAVQSPFSDPSQPWRAPAESFDPYASPDAINWIAPSSWMQAEGQKGFCETLFDPYLDVNGKCRLFPLASSLALDRGYVLPLPFGVSATYNYLRVSPAVRDVRVGFSGGEPVSLPVGVTNLDNKTNSAVVRVDGWLLPFLNIYGLAGKTWLTSTGDLSIPNPLPGPNITAPFRVKTDGPMIGGGAILAVGYKDWFLSLDANHTRTDFKLFSSSIRKTTAGVRTGFRTDSKLGGKRSLWIGGMFIERRTFLEGVINTGAPIDPVRYQLESEIEQPWAALIGGSWEMTSMWNVVFEVSFGSREQVIAAVNYRF